MAPSRKPARKSKPRKPGKVRQYTLEVYLLSGPVTDSFARKNPVVGRTILMRGDQTLAQLHRAVFNAFGREEEHFYEFQFGKGPMHPQAKRYVLPAAFETPLPDVKPPAGRVTDTTLDALELAVGDRFAYWFDFGDDWWHQVNVEAVEDAAPRGRYPRVTKRVGESPPQYAAEDEDEEDPQDLRGSAAADAACLIGEMHLRKGAPEKAVEAFTRALASRPTADAYEGRAKAYRALADHDEREARALR
jgi:hypothetical protein